MGIHQYSKLQGEKSLRLLTLLPGEFGADISCQLIDVSLQDDPEYEALSYVWGDASQWFEVKCNQGTLHITNSLHSALQHLRSSSSVRTIWADAICINQSDNDEKSIQVNLMGDIYLQASRVIVWIGEDEDNLGFALPVIENMYNFLLQNENDFPYSVLPVENRHDPGSPVYQALMTQQEHWRDPFLGLLKQKWFTRRWIIQEISKARTGIIQCGLRSISWDKLVNVYWCLYRNGVLTQIITTENSVVMSNTANLALIGQDSRHQKHAPILETVISTRGFQCTDARDVVYSVLGIIGDTKEYGDALLPDYSLSVADVYRKFVTGGIMKKRSLYALSVLYIPPKTGALKVPSWVPDFSRMEHGNPLIWMRVGTGLPFRAGTSRQQQTRVSSDGLRLFARGVEVDRVTLILPSVDEMTIDESPVWKHMTHEEQTFNTWLLMLWTTFIQFDQDGKEDPTSFEALWRTMIFDLDLGLNRPSPKFAEDFRYYVIHRIGHTVDAVDPGQEEQQIISQVAMTTIANGRGWRICKTQKGRLGRVLSSARVGDSVCVLFGGELPYIVRPIAGDEYKFIAPSFIYGLMDGEAVAEGETNSKDFCLV